MRAPEHPHKRVCAVVCDKCNGTDVTSQQGCERWVRAGPTWAQVIFVVVYLL